MLHIIPNVIVKIIIIIERNTKIISLISVQKCISHIHPWTGTNEMLLSFEMYIRSKICVDA